MRSPLDLEPRIRLVLIGDELLDGHTQDTNSQHLREALLTLGLSFHDQRMVRDSESAVHAEVVDLFQTGAPDLVISTGGLGPTVDDRTREILARAFGDTLELDDLRWAQLEARLLRQKRVPTERQRKQAMHPRAGSTLHNSCGSANGLIFRRENKVWVAMPGVPSEMEAMIHTGLIPFLKEHIGSRDHILTRSYRVFRVPEAELEAILEPLDEFQALGEVGFYPQSAGVLVRFKIPAMAATLQEEGVRALDALMALRLGERPYRVNPEQPVAEVFALLKEKKMRLALAESCTGGLMAQQLTALAGSSQIFLGGVVCYSNASKCDLLSVPKQLLEEEGAVSSACAEALVQGLLQRFHVEVALSITGIAGPSGGSIERPVGSVWLAMSTPSGVKSTLMQLHGNRQQIRKRAVAQAWLWILEEWK
jgi:nicotinamide-nucleotide amidase